jgi:hypothetical protein
VNCNGGGGGGGGDWAVQEADCGWPVWPMESITVTVSVCACPSCQLPCQLLDP